jgi:hypothetical protein
LRAKLLIEGDWGGWRRVFPAALFFGALIAQSLFLTGAGMSALPVFSRDGVVLAATIAVFAGIPSAAGLLLLAGIAERILRPRKISGLTVATACVFVILVVDAVFASLVFGVAGLAQVIGQHLMLVGYLLYVTFAARGRRGVPAVRFAIAGLVALAGGWVLAAPGGALRFSFPEEPTVRRTEPPHKGRILLIGLDGLGWDTMQRWRKSSDSEAGRWVLSRAYAAPLRTLSPAWSPLVWSTIATGLAPEDHGVLDYLSADFRWLARSRVSFPPSLTVLTWRKILQWIGVLKVLPVSSLDLHAHPFWEIVADGRRQVDERSYGQDSPDVADSSVSGGAGVNCMV